MDNMQAGTATQTNYLGRSWAMLTAEKGWIRPVLVLAAIGCIPLVGPIVSAIALIGYCLEWARLTAWGVDAVPKQRGVSVGGVMASGWRGLCVGIVWALCAAIVLGAFLVLLNLLRLDFLGRLLNTIVSLFLGLFILVACLRAAIYQRFGAGFGFSQLWAMVRRDANGLMHVFGVQLLGTVVTVVLGIMVSMILLVSTMPALMAFMMPFINSVNHGYLSSYEVMQIFSNMMTAFIPLWPAMLVVQFIFSIVGNVASLLSYNACGLWFRNFNVPSWGSPSDPLPE